MICSIVFSVCLEDKYWYVWIYVGFLFCKMICLYIEIFNCFCFFYEVGV